MPASVRRIKCIDVLLRPVEVENHRVHIMDWRFRGDHFRLFVSGEQLRQAGAGRRDAPYRAGLFILKSRKTPTISQAAGVLRNIDAEVLADGILVGEEAA